MMDRPPSPQTFSSYYQEFFEKVYNYIYFRVGANRELAEEFTQDVFLKALEHFDSFNTDSSFKTWIYKIAHNYIIDHYRKKKLLQSDLEDSANSIKASKDAKDTFIKDIDEKISLDQVNKAMCEMPNFQKELIILKYINEYEIEEIAGITGKDSNYLRVNIHRALNKLNSIINPNNENA